MNSESLAYFSDGHTEVITEFEISKDSHEVWFTVESGRWFVYKDCLVYEEGPSALIDTDTKSLYNPFIHVEHKFYKMVINRDHDEFGAKCDVQYLVTDEIEKIMLHMPD